MGNSPEQKQISANYVQHFYSVKAKWQKRNEYREDSLNAEAYILRDLVMDLTDHDLKVFLFDIFSENMQRLEQIFPYVENQEVIFWAFKWMEIAPIVVRERITKLLIELHQSACKEQCQNYRRVINNLHGIFDQYNVNLSEDDVRSVFHDIRIEDDLLKLQVLILVARQGTKFPRFWKEVEEKVENSKLEFLPALLELHLSYRNTEGLEKAMSLLWNIDSKFDSLDESYQPYFRYYIEEILYRIYSSGRSNELFDEANSLEKKLSKYSEKAGQLVSTIKQEPALSRIISEYDNANVSDVIESIEYKEVRGKLRKKINTIGQNADDGFF